MTVGDAMVKVSFICENGDVERMNAIKMKIGSYKLDNSPFYFYGISFGDIFAAAEKNGGELVFNEVVARGGHSTYRVRIPNGEGHDFFMKHWGPLEDLGCSYEGSDVGSQRLYAIDVPPSADIFKVYELLEQGEKGEIWVFEEGHYFNADLTE